jgi:hypothetical protein
MVGPAVFEGFSVAPMFSISGESSLLPLALFGCASGPSQKVELLPPAPLTTVETAALPPFPTVATTAPDFGMERGEGNGPERMLIHVKRIE